MTETPRPPRRRRLRRKLVGAALLLGVVYLARHVRIGPASAEAGIPEDERR